jgi:hypothetical protein
MDAIESIKDWHSDLLLEGVNVTFSETDHVALQTGRMLRATIKGGHGQVRVLRASVPVRGADPMRLRV